MKKVRTGNDIHIIWTITKNNAVLIDDEGLDLTGAEVLLIDTFKKPATFTYTINQIEENKVQVVGTFYGKDQKTQGKYNLLLVKNRGQENMITLDYVDAFILTCVSKFGVIEGTDESTVTVATIELDSDYNVYNGSPDMINYYTKEEIDQILEDYYTIQDIQNNYYDKSVIDSGLNGIVESITNLYETKANRTDLSLHTENDNIHVTLEDKALWNNVTSKADRTYVDSEIQSVWGWVEGINEDLQDLDSKVDTNNSNAVHKSGDELINGVKQFDNGIVTDSILYNGDELQDLLDTKADESDLTAHTSNTTIHVTQGNKALWNTVQDKVNYSDYIALRNWAEGEISDVNSALTAHEENTTIHVTQADKDNWNAKQSDLPLGRDTTANSLKYVSSTNSAINGCIEAAGQYAMVLGAGGRSTGNISAVLLGTVNTFYLTNTDNTYTTYELLRGSSVPSYNTIDFNSLHYYWAYAHNALVGSKIFDYSTKKYIGIITATTFDTTTPWKCTITLDKTNAEISFTTANNTRVIGSTTINKGSSSLLVGQYNCNLADNANVLGECNSVTQGAKYDIILGGGNCSKGMFNAVIGTRNFVDGVLSSGLGINAVFGCFNEINTSGAQVFGYANKVNNFTGLAANQVGVNCVFGSENNISTQGVFLGNYISSPTKTTRQMRYIVGAHITDVDGADSTTILGQYNDTFSNTNKFTLATGEENNTHNSVEVEYDSTNTEWTTKLNDTIKYADLTKVEGATALVMNEPQHEVTDGIAIGGVTYYLDPDIIVKKGQIVNGDANYSGTYVALATVNNGEYTLISETLGEKLEVTYKATTDTVVLVYCDGTFQPDYVGITIYDTIESLSEKSDKAVTSSTSNLKIEVVSAMPQTPDANTIYIVV